MFDPVTWRHLYHPNAAPDGNIQCFTSRVLIMCNLRAILGLDHCDPHLNYSSSVVFRPRTKKLCRFDPRMKLQMLQISFGNLGGDARKQDEIVKEVGWRGCEQIDEDEIDDEVAQIGDDVDVTFQLMQQLVQKRKDEQSVEISNEVDKRIFLYKEPTDDEVEFYKEMEDMTTYSIGAQTTQGVLQIHYHQHLRFGIGMLEKFNFNWLRL
ncbi:lectin protein kinase family protein [Prunus dulcis]|uniref:Lectin protein kinase family protein n=1 Tax=Prunus dulcis TaxID=3755 RepID=A0A4Y1RFF4_PRUDU|nr:lectin protein kinase family protein [Prunus dulcis]